MIERPRRDQPGDAQPPERADLAAWRRRHALRRSSAAQPVPSGRRYRRITKHRKREQDS
ncbi:hypothetical protein [Nocardia aurantia]|uniref:Uncharacterized protein n=1 Tax=Nocardia aurantia TaxID=2585199 RepID=A0A7K0DIC2_9NOCA|nr:hypothetical protein [Nocardia aurantia]MQY25439.1 hypothetical protein [Nocardia aurantia]